MERLCRAAAAAARRQGRARLAGVCRSRTLRVGGGWGVTDRPARDTSMSLFDDVRKIAKTATSGPPAEGPDAAEARRHAEFHWWIGRVAGCFAAVGAASGLLVAYRLM